MKQMFILNILFIAFFHSFGQFATTMHIEYSKNVGDSFEIYISLPPTYSLHDTYNVVYYCDANLKSGRHLRKLIATNQYNNQLKNIIFVGIGHIGNFHVLRNRDFIQPTIKGHDTAGYNKNYGQAEHFYAYLKNELIPSINSRFNTHKNNNSILGHSLGGLFAFYCLFKSDTLFTKYFALSPALWINKYSIYKFNNIQSGFSGARYLYFSAGSRETFNKILKGTNEAKQFFNKQHYANLNDEYDIWNGQTHISEIQLSLKKILIEKL